MAKTALLPTATAVRMTWAMTGEFSSDQASNTLATYTRDALNQMLEEAKAGSPEERSYVTCAAATMKASLRSLDTAYKGRELNFEENATLRQAYLASVEESLKFGVTAQDFLKSLPTMTIGAAGGVTVAQAMGVSGTNLWWLGVGMAAAGYLVNRIFGWVSRRKKQRYYVIQDYERCLYYDQYVMRVSNILLGLFLDLERIHMRLFGENFEPVTLPTELEKIIAEILKGVHSTFCPYAHKHMREKKITPELWSQCESGVLDVVRSCDHWEDKKTAIAVAGK